MSEEKLQFYRVTDTYLQFLKQIEPKVHLNYPHRKKPYIGIILTIGSHQYHAPLSSYKPEKYDRIKNSNKTIFKVYGKDQNEQLAVIHLNNMFPIIQTEVEWMVFQQEPQGYRNLLEKEYRFIVANQETIRKRASDLYQDVIKGNTFYSRISNDFALLEKEYRKFNKNRLPADSGSGLPRALMKTTNRNWRVKL
ncbi:type III toxin-antitoxin system ToxN/AbiQ family toxin [Paenibacillaceae bacterium WGS1546]|uniref:type III toxin-antitoxin system ToxN/AbiQ family toxin n=1 Tax=Cohnella sp. WGS1546 TaxID=3366810 RepID=UPI00372D466E